MSILNIRSGVFTLITPMKCSLIVKLACYTYTLTSSLFPCLRGKKPFSIEILKNRQSRRSEAGLKTGSGKSESTSANVL